MNDLQIFNNEKFGAIRALEINNAPWFCLADVCNPLGLKAYKCKERLREGGILTRDTPTNSGTQKMLYVNEGNLYRTIFQSKKPEAEQFTDWVTEEVLPSLRKHGTYTIHNSVPPSISPSGLAQLIRITRRVMLDMGSTPNDVGQMMCGLYNTWAVPVPQSLKGQVAGQFSLFDSSALMVEGKQNG